MDTRESISNTDKIISDSKNEVEQTATHLETQVNRARNYEIIQAYASEDKLMSHATCDAESPGES
jgi:hypothetical protein